MSRPTSVQGAVSSMKLLLVLAGTLLSIGCAVTRGELDVRVDARQPVSTDGPAVFIKSVNDARVFELKPNKPSIPSLKDGDIENSALTSRAIARKRNTYGKAMGDILLPEDRTVEMLVGDTLTSAFQQAGFRVIDAEQVEPGEAIPVEVEVLQFWGWFTPGFWAAKLDFEVRLRVTAAVQPFEQGEEVSGSIRLKTQGASSSRWMNTINKGLEDLIANTRARLEESR